MFGLDLCADFADVLKPPRIASLPQLTDAAIHVYQCDAASLSALFDNARQWHGQALVPGAVAGAGAELDKVTACFKAACEAAERYSSSILLSSEYRIATYDELGDQAIDWKTFPRLSAEELHDPLQPFAPFQPNDPVRWVMGMHLQSGRQLWIPTSMTHLFPRLWSTERFCVPISTGTAVHSDELTGIASGLCEVIERDATALTWLLKRPIKRIEPCRALLEAVSSPIGELLESNEVIIYNATTDTGVPTVYARRKRPGNERAANVVACAASFRVVTSMEKAVAESVMISRTLEQDEFAVVDAPEDCMSVHDGAVFMSRDSQKEAFAFLDTGGSVAFTTLLASEPSVDSTDPAERLAWMINRLSTLDMDVYVVNLTCDELADVGLKCYRVIVPQLMPMSLITRGRFLATPRLEQVNRDERLNRVLPRDVNQHPQPFA